MFFYFYFFELNVMYYPLEYFNNINRLWLMHKVTSTLNNFYLTKSIRSGHLKSCNLNFKSRKIFDWKSIKSAIWSKVIEGLIFKISEIETLPYIFTTNKNQWGRNTVVNQKYKKKIWKIRIRKDLLVFEQVRVTNRKKVRI